MGVKTVATYIVVFNNTIMTQFLLGSIYISACFFLLYMQLYYSGIHVQVRLFVVNTL